MLENGTFLYLTLFISNIAPPVPPNGVKVVHITRRSAKVKWNLLPIVQSYGVITGYAIRILERTTFNSLNATYTVNNQQRKFQITDLLPSSKYAVEVAAITSGGTGIFSKPVIFLTQGGKT